MRAGSAQMSPCSEASLHAKEKLSKEAGQQQSDRCTKECKVHVPGLLAQQQGTRQN